jgi:hypothetical protein
MDAIAVVISSSVTGKISSSFDISVMYLFSTTAIASINKRKSADFHNLTIEHILHAGENITTVLKHILNSIFLE